MDKIITSAVHLYQFVALSIRYKKLCLCNVWHVWKVEGNFSPDIMYFL